MFSSIRQKNLINRRNMRSISNIIKITEVGPRDGLQNESKIVPTVGKIALINKLSETGLKSIEVTSFVSPKWIPQMQDNFEVLKTINKKSGINYPVLIPNLKGLEKALKAEVKEIAIFVSASEEFSKKNTNCSIEQSIKRFRDVTKVAGEHNLKIRGYISCIAGCPYEGAVKSSVIANLSVLLFELGCYEISLGDTIGIGTPKIIRHVLNELKHVSGSGDLNKFAIHCHNTYGQGLSNIYASLDQGIRSFDSSVAGLGGCPYAAGASGNIPTEDLIYLLHGEGFYTGVDLNKVVEIGDWISKELKRENQSKVGVAFLAKKNKEKCN